MPMNAIVACYLANTKTVKELAEEYHYSVSTIYYLIRKQKDPSYHNGKRGRQFAITPGKAIKILYLIGDEPTVTLDEIIRRCDLNVSKSTLSRFFRRINISYKKMSRKNLKRLTLEYVQKVLRFRDEFIDALTSKNFSGEIVAIDECGVTTNLARTRGWAPIGKEAICYDGFSKQKRISLIGAIGTRGSRLLSGVDGGVKSDDFLEFMKELYDVIPDGSCILMDNAAIHKTQTVKEFINQNKENKVIYLPPYTPEFNPIELVWSVLKSDLRAYNLKENERANLVPLCKQIYYTMSPKYFFDCFGHAIKEMKEVFKFLTIVD